jgi:transcriptional regulator with XRE-family HTH domain
MSGAKIAETGALDCAALCRFLSAAFPHSTAKQVAFAAGIPASSVEKWLRGETRPSGLHFAQLIGIFGLPLIAAAIPSAQWARENAHERKLDLARQLAKQILAA